MKKRLLLKAALRYARRGWQVLPLHSVKNGRCSCGDRECQKAGKHPRTKHGVKDATTDKDVIRARWRKWPNANIGIATGARSGIVVVDIDPRHDGNLSFRRLIQQHGPLPPCPKVITGGGGRHRYFEYPGVPVKSRAAVLPGIDVRADGGYVVAPPSRHASGKRYRWREGASLSALKPPSLPKRLLRLIEDKPRINPLTDKEQIFKGERNSALTSLAGAMRHRGATEEALVAALRKENQKRCVPPLSDKEVRNIAASVARYPPAEEGKDHKRKADFVRALLGDGVTFFHTHDQDAYANLKVADHIETAKIRETSFKRYVAARYYRKCKGPIPAQFLHDVLATLEGIAVYDSPTQEVFTRLAEYEGAIYLDLCNESWQVVKITAESWRVLSDSPVRFRRARGMKELPVPKGGGSIEALRPFLNVQGDEDFVLIVSWLVAALRPKGPYPVLVLQGEAGSAKSTTVRVLRDLTDPNTSPLRSEPRETRDLMIAARNSWCIAFDNVSRLSQRLSDDLCRMATGGGFSTRQLYTDNEEILFSASRPVLLNGIDTVVYRGDLLDRSLLISLPVIPEYQRKTEKHFWELFNKVQPKLIGALLDAVSCGLRRLESVDLPGKPRMADFAQWAVAAEKAFGWAEGAFLRAYDSNRGVAVALSLEASPIVMPLTRFLLTRSAWRGTAAQLLRRIEKNVEIEVARQRSWPANPQLLSSQLRRIAPHLRATGLDIQFGEKTPGMGSKRIITITRRDPEGLRRHFPREKSDAPDADSRRSHDRDKRRERRTRRGFPSEE
ncbi:MAG: bifunctional DNA primase/polymerase [Candidatus Acidiferrales bacterium]